MQQLELVLRWEGRLGNARLREIFALSQIRTSQMIKEFRDAYPDWTQWNSLTKTFDATFKFYESIKSRRDDADSLSLYSTLIRLKTSVIDVSSSVVVAAFPELSAPDARIFATLIQAANANRQVEIEYRSMNEPTPHLRIISPHSIVRTGRRWHVRGYSQLNQQFRDYTLGRISAIKLLTEPSEKRKQDDLAWMTEVPVRLIPHPDMSYEQGTVIRFELFSGCAAGVTTCRGALVRYFIQDVRAAVDTNKQQTPDYQLAVENINEVKEWLF